MSREEAQKAQKGSIRFRFQVSCLSLQAPREGHTPHFTRYSVTFVGVTMVYADSNRYKGLQTRYTPRTEHAPTVAAEVTRLRSISAFCFSSSAFSVRASSPRLLHPKKYLPLIEKPANQERKAQRQQRRDQVA